MIEIYEQRVTFDKNGRPDEDQWKLRALRLRTHEDPEPEPTRSWGPLTKDGDLWVQYRTVLYYSAPELWGLHNTLLPGIAFVEPKTGRISLRIAEVIRAWAPVVKAAVEGDTDRHEAVVKKLPPEFR